MNTAELKKLAEDAAKNGASIYHEFYAAANPAAILKLLAINAELVEALSDVSYALEKARIWGGMDWTYNPLHPLHYLPARDKARAALAKAEGGEL